jgi:ligand-binding sensor domain-containing protein
MDQDGNLWAGGPGGIVRWNIETGDYDTYTTQNGLANNNVVAIAQSGDGSIWVGTMDSGASRFDGEVWKTYTVQDGLPSNYVSSLVVVDGDLWLLTSEFTPISYKTVVRYENGAWVRPTIGDLDLDFLDQIVVSPDRTLWGWFGNHAIGYSLYSYDGSSWYEIAQMQVRTLTTDRTTAAWVATNTNAYRIQKGIITELLPPWMNQLQPGVTSIAVTPNLTAWFGFSFYYPLYIDRCGLRDEFTKEQGVYRYDGGEWTHFTTDDGLADNKVCAIVSGPDDSVWVGTYDKGISRFDGKRWVTYAVP